MAEVSKEYKDFTLRLSVGKNENSEDLYIDFAQIGNLLLLGDSGTGKTNFMKNVLLSLGKNTSPEFCQIVVIDSSFDYDAFDGMKHISAVISSPDAILECLKNVQEIIEDRYRILSKDNCRNIEVYNSKAKEKLPHIVICIDEFAPLMISHPKEICAVFERICTMGRVPGVHLIIGTKEFMPEVFNATIRYLFKDFVAFNISKPKCDVDYIKVYLDGIEPWKLERGEHILKIEDIAPVLLKGQYLTDEEIEKTVKSIKKETKSTGTNAIERLFRKLFDITNKANKND